MNKQQFANYEDKKTVIPVKGKVIRFGAIADTHLGSKYSQPTFLKWFYRYLKKSGAQFVLHAGDLTDGENVYSGQVYESFIHGYDDSVEYVKANYPNGLPTYFITGNHDLRWFERGGSDIGVALAKERPDLHYLGQLGAYVYIGGVRVYLVHTMGMPAYALSYKAQKLVEAFSTENKPNIMIVGHFHTAFQAFIRNVHVLHPSSFQGQTPYLRRRAIFPVIGGYLIEIEINSKGIDRFKFEFIPLYKPKANDWR